MKGRRVGQTFVNINVHTSELIAQHITEQTVHTPHMYNLYRNATLRNSTNKLNSCHWVAVEGTKQNTVPYWPSEH